MTSSKGTPTETVSKTESVNDGKGVSIPSENGNGSEMVSSAKMSNSGDFKEEQTQDLHCGANSEHSKHLGRTTDYDFQGPNR